jgi:hypothetical protein
VQRLGEALNKPIGSLVVGMVIVAVCVFLYFGYYLPRTTTAPGSPSTTRTERTEPTTTVEEKPRPATRSQYER